MCGIFGYVGSNRINLKEATDVIIHRGPDSEGFLQYYDESNELINGWKLQHDRGEKRVLFGFRRLSIIDLSTHANQPFSDESKQFHIIFNGEIYNYLELRDELERLGVKFSTKSDTEVLLQAYKKWGPKCLKKFNGMWAFSILDCKNRKLFCSRDRFGIKPLFYHLNSEGDFVFASEIKQFFAAGIEKIENPSLIRDYIDWGILDFTDQTFFEGIEKFPAGSYVEIDLSKPIKEICPESYWDIGKISSNYTISLDEAKDEFKRLFYDSVRLRFRSDVPVGSCLSGGLDSSSIVSVALDQFNFPIQSFTLGTGIDSLDETSYVELLSRQFTNLKTNFCYLTPEAFIDQFDEVLTHQDEPFSSMSMVAQWEVIKLAHSKGIKVLLDGQGGDELLGGYRKFYAFYLKELLISGNYRTLTSEVVHLLLNSKFHFFDIHGIKKYLNYGKGNHDFYNEKGKSIKSTADFGINSAKTVRERMELDIEKFSYPPLLRYEDRNSMAFSIESRVPFMDFRLVEFLISLPTGFKIHKGHTKYILRQSLHSILPRPIVERTSKLGFETPQEVWMHSTLYEHFHTYFAGMDNPYFNTKKILYTFEHSKKDKSVLFKLFRIYCFDKWYKMHFD